MNMYCSTSITLYLFRGFAALALLTVALTVHAHPLVFVLLLGTSFMLLRGCPMCWLVGLFEKLRSQASIQAQNKDINHE